MMFDSDAAGVEFIRSSRRAFQRIKQLGEQAIEQLEDSDLTWSPDPRINSVAVLAKHFRINMITHWVETLPSDRKRTEQEFENQFTPPDEITREQLVDIWEEGWACLFHALNSLTPDDLMNTVLKENETLSVYEAIHRQLSHSAYHVGQMVLLAKMRKRGEWRTLTISRDKPSVAMTPGR